MAQGLDVRCLSSARSPPPPTDSGKAGEPAKRSRGLGSRRIFSPQFKLQVLDSYRNDLDCRGNQRATARKYNIHRRQIQKWLQCEQSLRTSVGEGGKNESVSKSVKKSAEEDQLDLTLNRSAVATAESARLADAGRCDEAAFRSPNKIHPPPPQAEEEDSKTEARNLKRVAQKLYPSLPRPVSAPRVGTNYFRGHVSCLRAFDLSPDSAEKRRDDNFNEIVRTEKVEEESELVEEEEKPLDLKNRVRSKISPEEEFLESNVAEEILPEDNSDKLNIGSGEIRRSGLTPSGENVGGPKSSASDSVLKCLDVQKSNMGDIGERELSRSEDSKRTESLGPRMGSDGGPESSRLPEIPVPERSSSSVSQKPDGNEAGGKRKSSTEDEGVEGEDGEPRSKKSKMEILPRDSRVEPTKSFNPKRKWMRESMQEMLESESDRQSSPEPSSLPIKQRVKMNLRSQPPMDISRRSEDHPAKSNGISSNFTIEKLCSTTDDSGEAEGLHWCDINPPRSLAASETFFPSFAPPPRHLLLHPPPPPLVVSDRDFMSLRLKAADDYHPLSVSLKEEKIFDVAEEEEDEEVEEEGDEDADVDVLSTTPTEKKSFDFSGYNFGKRRSFSVQFKLTVLDAFYHDKDCNKNQRATARKFNINRRQVQKWLSQESDLRSESCLKGGKYLQRQRTSGPETKREGDGCTRCPRHCLGRREEVYDLDQTIEVNVKHCSDRECLRGCPDPSKMEAATVGGGSDFYGRKTLPFPAEFYRNYFYPENNNVVYRHDSNLGWSHLNSSALTVPNYQCLSPAWHQNFDLRHENPKIY